MALTIISQGKVCDGYDVSFVISDGTKMTFHSPNPDITQPEIDSALITMEQRYMEELVTAEEQANAEEILQ